MNFQLLIGLFFTILPFTELRVGLPIIIDYVVKNNLNIIPYFFLVIILNIFVIFVIFLFLDYLHNLFLRFNWYSNFFNKRISKIQKKSIKFQKRFDKIGYLALIFFVSIPLPMTGAWTGTLLAWLLKLNRGKSILSISVGVIIAGLIMLFAFSSIYIF